MEDVSCDHSSISVYLCAGSWLVPSIKTLLPNMVSWATCGLSPPKGKETTCFFTALWAAHGLLISLVSIPVYIEKRWSTYNARRAWSNLKTFSLLVINYLGGSWLSQYFECKLSARFVHCIFFRADTILSQDGYRSLFSQYRSTSANFLDISLCSLSIFFSSHWGTPRWIPILCQSASISCRSYTKSEIFGLVGGATQLQKWELHIIAIGS